VNWKTNDYEIYANILHHPVVPTIEHGYVFGGKTNSSSFAPNKQMYMSDLVSQLSNYEARSQTFPRGTPTKRRHNVFMHVKTPGSDTIEKISVNICEDCYDLDPRDICLMDAELKELRSAKQSMEKEIKHLTRSLAEKIDTNSSIAIENEQLRKQLEAKDRELDTYRKQMEISMEGQQQQDKQFEQY
jgi:hypothetical protein